MNWKVPSLPILLKRPAVPPVHIELPICKLQYLSYNIKKDMKETVEPNNPHNRIWN